MKLAAALLLSLAASTALSFFPSAAQKKPKPALKNSDAQRAVAATPGFALNRGVVRVRTVSPVGETPILVTAEVDVAVAFEQAKEGKDGASAWRAVEFRTGDRSWDEFEYFSGPLDPSLVEQARDTLGEMAAEFEAEQLARKKAEEKAEGKKEKGSRAEASDATDAAAKPVGEAKDEKKIEVRRGPFVLKEFAPMYKSARGLVSVEATFRLERGTGKNKWQVASFRIGNAEFSGFDALLAAVNRRKAERARADLETVRAALEDYRRARGFYVVADSETILIDHLAPLYLKTIIRIDPWHRPYRYTGTRDHFTLSSDGPDGLPSTQDDLTIRG